MPNLTTRKYAKRREKTCGYAKGVDGINSCRSGIDARPGWPPRGQFQHPTVGLGDVRGSGVATATPYGVMGPVNGRTVGVVAPAVSFSTWLMSPFGDWYGGAATKSTQCFEPPRIPRRAEDPLDYIADGVHDPVGPGQTQQPHTGMAR